VNKEATKNDVIRFDMIIFYPRTSAAAGYGLRLKPAAFAIKADWI
jgi:hypothetical protein